LAQSKAIEIAASVGKPFGFTPESNKPEEFERFEAKEDKADIRKTGNLVSERVLREVKSIGENTNEEIVESLSNTQTQAETVHMKKFRSQSTERASMLGKSVGYVGDEETPKFFDDKFEVKHSQATTRRSKTSATERVLNKEANQGYIPEMETSKTFGDFHAKSETAISTKIRSQSTEKAAYVGKDVGFVGEEESPEFFDDKFQVEKNNASMKKETSRLTEFAIMEPKHLALSAKEEAAHDIMEFHAKEEKLLSKKVRSQSNERAANSSQTVGYVNNEEAPTFFDDKFKVMTSNANLKKEKSNVREQALNSGTTSAFTPEVEDTKDLEKDKIKSEAALSTNVKNQITERALRKSSNVGESTKEETLYTFSGSRAETETALSKRVRSQSNERVSYNPQSLGSVQDEETPEFFEDKFEVKSSNAESKKVMSKASERVTKRVKTGGYIPEEETLEYYNHTEQKLENACSSKIRRTSTEQASRLSQNIGFKPEEAETAPLKDLSMKQEQGKQKRVRSESCERAATQTTSIGYLPEGLSVEEFERFKIQEEHAKEMNSSERKSLAAKQSQNIGFQPTEYESKEFEKFYQKGEEATQSEVEVKNTQNISMQSKVFGFEPSKGETGVISEVLPEFDTLIPIKVQHSSTERALRICREEGELQNSEKTADFEKSLQRGQKAKSQRTNSKSSERVSLVSVSSGFEANDHSTDELVVDKTKEESITPNKFTAITRGKASRTSKKLGYAPSENISEDLGETTIKTENAKLSQTRSESSDRAIINPNKMGFEPLELNTQKLKDIDMKSSYATEKHELARKEKVQKVSISSGVLSENQHVDELETSVLIPQSNADIGEVVSPKQRATSQIRVQGFEPIVEDTKEYTTENLILEKSLKGEDKVHRESRSRALKRETNTGVRF